MRYPSFGFTQPESLVENLCSLINLYRKHQRHFERSSPLRQKVWSSVKLSWKWLRFLRSPKNTCSSSDHRERRKVRPCDELHARLAASTSSIFLVASLNRVRSLVQSICTNSRMVSLKQIRWACCLKPTSPSSTRSFRARQQS